MKRHAPAAARNGAAITAVLAEELPQTGTVLEVASGTGEHAVRFARAFPHLTWQPSDMDQSAMAGIAEWAEESGLANLREPITLDTAGAMTDWPGGPFAAVLCINMVHISPWAATEGLFGGAARLLAGDGPLVLYGPYIEADLDTVASNLAFDASLRARDPRWGLRDTATVDALALDQRMLRTARHTMPANNIMLTYRKAAR
ncbi:UPF0585 protein C16orf13 like protein [Alteripontixanthobacter maritimus]|uniref:UPF0585 protein C16orf13 like protein n=1 Tax=Alteripontixanthobacter maritimus TaxID=2161824 RepID=A0A369Q7R8_9SPHN|nr:DUF938 domain-containing protein [Alteripontixanthobacter maritimus]RDC60754.1 UPF0585 protein C16orf13 like protein [Alteripontixanthobacter maritimus]